MSITGVPTIPIFSLQCNEYCYDNFPYPRVFIWWHLQDSILSFEMKGSLLGTSAKSRDSMCYFGCTKYNGFLPNELSQAEKMRKMHRTSQSPAFTLAQCTFFRRPPIFQLSSFRWFFPFPFLFCLAIFYTPFQVKLVRINPKFLENDPLKRTISDTNSKNKNEAEKS